MNQSFPITCLITLFLLHNDNPISFDINDAHPFAFCDHFSLRHNVYALLIEYCKANRRNGSVSPSLPINC